MEDSYPHDELSISPDASVVILRDIYVKWCTLLVYFKTWLKLTVYKKLKSCLSSLVIMHHFMIFN